jgi:hypothetical protein
MPQDNIARLDGNLQELLGQNPLRTAWDLFRAIDETLSMQVPYSAGPPHPRVFDIVSFIKNQEH